VSAEWVLGVLEVDGLSGGVRARPGVCGVLRTRSAAPGINSGRVFISGQRTDCGEVGAAETASVVASQNPTRSVREGL